MKEASISQDMNGGCYVCRKDVITMGKRIYTTKDAKTGIYAVHGGYDINGKPYKIVYRQKKSAANTVAEARRTLRDRKRKR
jgi:hypothetical protein